MINLTCPARSACPAFRKSREIPDSGQSGQYGWSTLRLSIPHIGESGRSRWSIWGKQTSRLSGSQAGKRRCRVEGVSKPMLGVSQVRRKRLSNSISLVINSQAYVTHASVVSQTIGGRSSAGELPCE